MTYIVLLFWTLAQTTFLGADDYSAREAACLYLRAAGPFAVPALYAAARSDSPEARARAQALLPKYRSAALQARVLRVLDDPWPLDERALWKDVRFRYAINDYAKGRYPEQGYEAAVLDAMTSDDTFNPWREGNKAHDAAEAVYTIREWRGVRPPWFLR